MARPIGLPHDEIAGLYGAGVQISDIASRHRCSERAVRHIARKFPAVGAQGNPAADPRPLRHRAPVAARPLRQRGDAPDQHAQPVQPFGGRPHDAEQVGAAWRGS